MNCGSCKNAHETVAEVKRCYGLGQTITVQASPAVIDAEAILTAELGRLERLTALANVKPSPVLGQTIKAQAVPAGRYAIGEGDDVRFYLVDKPTEGRWQGWTFLSVQAGDEGWPIKNKNEKARILAEIGRDVKGAMLAYGKLIGKCGHCGRTLTNAESRGYGIGPICRAGMGW